MVKYCWHNDACCLCMPIFSFNCLQILGCSLFTWDKWPWTMSVVHPSVCQNVRSLWCATVVIFGCVMKWVYGRKYRIERILSLFELWAKYKIKRVVLIYMLRRKYPLRSLNSLWVISFPFFPLSFLCLFSIHFVLSSTAFKTITSSIIIYADDATFFRVENLNIVCAALSYSRVIYLIGNSSFSWCSLKCHSGWLNVIYTHVKQVE